MSGGCRAAIVLVVLLSGRPATAQMASDPAAQRLLEAGEQQFKRLAFADAADTARRTIAFAPDEPYAHFLLGRALSGLRQGAEAEVALSKTIELNPELALAWSYRGFARALQGHYEAGVADCNKALSLEPGQPRHLGYRALILMQLERHDTALADLDKAIPRQPRNFELHCWRGSVLLRLERHEEALDALRSAIALKPSWGEPHAYAGMALEALGRHDKAEASWQTALDLLPVEHALVVYHANQRARTQAPQSPPPGRLSLLDVLKGKGPAHLRYTVIGLGVLALAGVLIGVRLLMRQRA